MDINRLLKWLDSSTCNFLAVETIRKELDNAGFVRLRPEDAWNLKKGDRRYITKNDSAVFAFIVGEESPAEAGFRIVSAHSDSPCFKIKPNAEIYGDGGVVSLNVEKYGGGILYTWFDRPLSISGRVMTAGEDALHPVTRFVDLKRPVAFIPHLAIHFNRGVNQGNPILEYELCLYPLEPAATAGNDNEYFQSARIDDLSMAYAGLEALLNTADTATGYTRIVAVFDNEETGSGTKQGSASPVLAEMMQRITASFDGEPQEQYFRAVANSFMISADDAHAWHPNYNEKYDPTNHPVIGGGPVIKINANCKYMTDAQGAAVFRQLCNEAGVKCQYFVNHSDVAGGSTLGNILTSQIPLNGVDMGCAIWAMHSARETAGVADHFDTVRVFSTFFGA